MKKLMSSLPAKLLIGIVVGILLGLVAPEGLMKVIVPVKNILGQVIQFVVPQLLSALLLRPSQSWATTQQKCLALHFCLHMYLPFWLHLYQWLQVMLLFLLCQLQVRLKL